VSESFDQTFLKVCGVEGQRPPRAPQSAKSLFGVSFCQAFSLRLFPAKKKRIKKSDHLID